MYQSTTNKKIIRNLEFKSKSKLPKSFQIGLEGFRRKRMRLSKEAVIYVEQQIKVGLANKVIKQKQVFKAKAGLISTGIEHAKKYGKSKVGRGNLVKGWRSQSIFQCIPGECFSRTIFSQEDQFEQNNPSFKELIK